MTTPKSEPIFILAAGRSGSTLLRYMLDSHRDVSSPGELFLGQLCSWLVTSLPRLWPSGNIGADSQVQSEVLLEARRIVDQIMAGYLSRTGKRLWCEKTPANLGHLSSMAQIFPEARYICLYRSCLDTISSCIEASTFGFPFELQDYVVRSPSNIVQAMMESWVDKNTTLAMFEVSHPKTSLRLRYEDLVRNPEERLREVCRFLDLSWDPRMATSALQIEHYLGGGDGKILREKDVHQRSVGKGNQIPSHWLDAVPQPLLGRASELSKHLGYDPIRVGRPTGRPASRAEPAATI